MAKGKSQYCTWSCPNCKTGNYISYYDKRRDADIVKEISKFCSKCRAHTLHKRKDTKKGSAN